MKSNLNLILDFDSTFVRTEALEELAKLAYPGNRFLLKQIEDITAEGMSGEISFSESLSRRLKLLNISHSLLKKLSDLLKSQVSPSILENKQFFRKNANSVYIVSGGFHEFIDEVVADYGITSQHVLANRFVFDERGTVSGYRSEGTKSQLVKRLNLKGTTVMVGDGYTDWEVKQGGGADQFVAYTENVKREAVIKLADWTCSSFGEIIKGLR